MKIVAGFDLSYTRSACVLLNEKFHVVGFFDSPIELGPKRLLRALKLYRGWLGHAPLELAVIEDNAYESPSRVGVVKLSRLNTLAMVACEHLDLAFEQKAPGVFKKFATGSGKASKHEVAEALKRRYGIQFVGDCGCGTSKKKHDLSDAASMAAWGVDYVKKRS